MNMKRGLIFLLFVLLVSLLVINVSSINNNQGQLKVTLEHPFFVDNEWVEAGDLEVGDILKTSDGRKAVISGIEKVVDEVEVYNLHVDGPETYYANDVLVHNKPMWFLGRNILPEINLNIDNIPLSGIPDFSGRVKNGRIMRGEE